jgi:hypothetical protein
VGLATSYIEAAQHAGQLADFNIQRFLLRVASLIVTFHASPTMRRYILGPNHSIPNEREALLQSIRDEVAPERRK